MTRPATIVESGSGYTTLFLLRALADNQTDVAEALPLLRQKTQAILPNIPDDFAKLDQYGVRRVLGRMVQWLGAGGKACNADPAYYLSSYSPHLYSVEELPADHDYSRAMKRAVADLGHEALFTPIHGKFSDAVLPPRIDLAWNDHAPYEEFFEICWSRLNESGGLLVFHNVTAVKQLWNAVEWMKKARSAQGDLEVLILQEPHKLDQSGCAVLRRTTMYHPPFALEDPGTVLKTLRKFQSL